jgi:2-C-methyl-D-erythritol 4-phosphate cytidylyltransferase
MNTAIIAAAGSGSRLGREIPKQFVEVLGKPLVVHTLERFVACEAIDEIVVVVAEDYMARMRRIVEAFAIEKIVGIVAGAATRAGSVLNGLNAVSESTSIVAVHDAARPLVAADDIAATVDKAAECGAACLVAEVTDTIKVVEGGEIVRTLDRKKLQRALTPQAFRIEVLRRAYEQWHPGEEATDECYLVEKLGHPIAAVEGSPRNIKVTRSDDLFLIEAFLGRELED